MANILSLAVRVTGDASGLQLTPVEKALQRLQQESDKTSAIFEKFAQSSELGAKAQETFNAASDALLQSLRDGNITRDEFVRQFEELEAGARETAAALAEGARVTEANRTAEERYAVELQRLNGLREKGGIDQENYNRAVAAARKPLDDAAAAAERAAQASGNSTLKFNELSGVFSVLPGPLGNVAGRLSGLSSAGEGLSRIFAGGLQSGITGIIGSVTALVNPVTLALAGVTAFAAGASKLAESLVALEDRVEKLGRLADQLGVSFGFVQVLEEAGKRTDVSVQQISSSFARLQNTLASTDEEGKKASEALGRLGISLEDFGKLSQEQQIELIGEKLAGIEDPAQRSAAAIALFGKSGVQLLPFFNELGLAAADMERFGRAITDIDRQRLADLGGGLDALGLAAQGLGDSLTLPFVGLGEGIARAGAEIVAGLRAIIDPIGQIFEPVFTQLGRTIELAGQNIGNLGRVIGATFEPLATIVSEISVALEPLYDGIFDFLGSIGEAAVATTEWLVSFSPIGIIAENIGSVVSVIRDALAPVFETVGRVVEIASAAFQRFYEIADQAIGDTVRRAAELVSGFLEWTGIGDQITQTITIVSNTFTSLVNSIQAAIEQLGKFIDSALTFAENWLGIKRQIEEPVEVQVDIAPAVALTDELTKAQEKVLQFGNAGTEVFLEYASQLDDIAALVAEGEYTQQQANRAIALATAEYEKQVKVLSDQAKAQEELAKAEQQRQKEAEAATQRQVAQVDALLEKQQGVTQLQKDTLAVETEIARVEAAAAQARAKGQTDEASALASRLSQLDQLQASLNEQADQAAQGFDGGFEDAFQSVESGIAKLTENAKEFGQAGFDAALQLQEGIAAAQKQAEGGVLNAEAFEAEVARQEELYKTRIAQLEDERDRRIKAEKDIADERQRVNQFVDEQLALAEFGGDSARLAASRNVAAIEQETARVQAEVDAARAAGDQAAVQAGTARLGQLDQIAAKEADIASGRAAKEAEIAKQREAAIAQQQKNTEAFAKAQEQQAQQAQAAQQKRSEEFQAALQAQAAENERILANRRRLATASNQAAQGADIRTSEGANAFIQAVQGGFDPQLAVQRQQLKVQQRIAVGLEANLNALGFQTFRFPAAAGV